MNEGLQIRLEYFEKALIQAENEVKRIKEKIASIKDMIDKDEK